MGYIRLEIQDRGVTKGISTNFRYDVPFLWQGRLQHMLWHLGTSHASCCHLGNYFQLGKHPIIIFEKKQSCSQAPTARTTSKILHGFIPPRRYLGKMPIWGLELQLGYISGWPRAPTLQGFIGHYLQRYIRCDLESFITPLCQLLFGEEPPCVSNRSMEIVIKVAHWFPIQEGTFIRVFGINKAPHSLPRFVMDMILLWEVYYQMT